MSENPDSFLTLSSSRNQPSFLWAALFVIVMHLVLLGVGKHWNPAPPKPKERQKVIVQTISLDSPRTSSAQIRAVPPSSPPAAPAPAIAAPSPKQAPVEEIPKAVIPPAQEEVALIEEIPPPKEEVIPEQAVKKEEPPTPIEEAPPIPAPVQKPAPAPAKKESKPQPKAAPPKPAVKETKKPAAKPPAPVKKPAETAKKTVKQETAKPNPEAEKKKQQEKAEADKKKQQEKAEADKKKQKEQAEAEKKRQQELAAEQKRKQEIAAAEEAAREKERALISKAKETLAKMGETRDKIASSPSINLETTALPKELGTLQVDALPVDSQGGGGDWGAKEVSYSGEVASRLKKGLRLPDYGAVKIKLTLDRTGKVIKVETVHSESSKNKTYVESKVPTLLFPPFGQRFKEASENTFVITLQNDS